MASNKKITFDVNVKSKKAEGSLKKLSNDFDKVGKSAKQGVKTASTSFKELDKSVNKTSSDVSKLTTKMGRLKGTTAKVSAGMSGGAMGGGAMGGGLGVGGIALGIGSGKLLSKTGSMMGARIADFKAMHKQTGQLSIAWKAATSNVSVFNKVLITSAGAAAVAATALYALKKAYDFGKEGAAIQDLETGFASYANSLGTSADKILKDLTKVSNGTIAQADLMKAAGNAMLLGLPAEKLAGLMEIARASSVITGQSVTQAFNDITLAVGRGSKMILDNLGIIVDVGKANKVYAKTLGLAADELSDVQKKQAFLNATMTAGKVIIDNVGGIDRKSDAYAQFGAEISNLTDDFKIWVSEGLEPAVRMMGNALVVLKAIREGADNAPKIYDPAAVKKAQLQLANDWNAFTKGKSGDTKRDIQAGNVISSNIPLSPEGYSEATEEEIAVAQEKQSKLLALRAEYSILLAEQGGKDLEARKLGYEEEYRLAVEAYKGKEDLYKKEMEILAQIKDAKIEGAYSEAEKAQLEEQKQKIEELGSSINDAITTPIADGFKAMIDGSKSTKEAFKDMAKGMLANLAEIIIKQTLLNSLQGGTSGGGVGGYLAGLFHSGGEVGQTSTKRSVNPGLFVNAPRFHNGLAGDEFPAILQKGETVIPKGKSTSTGSRTPTINIVNKTSKEIDSAESSFDFLNNITNIVLKDISNNKNGSRNSMKALLR